MIKTTFDNIANNKERNVNKYFYLKENSNPNFRAGVSIYTGMLMVFGNRKYKQVFTIQAVRLHQIRQQLI